MKLKEYGFLSFAKNIGINVRNKYSRNLLDKANKSTTDAINIKNYLKREMQTTAEATGDLIGHIIADKIASLSKNFSRELQKKEANNEIEMPKER